MKLDIGIYLRRLGSSRLFVENVDIGIGVILNSGVENWSFFVVAGFFCFAIAPVDVCCFVNGSISIPSSQLFELKAMIC